MLENMPDSEKQLIDIISILTAVGTLTALLPSIAAILTIIWTIIRIYETETFKKWRRSNDEDHLD